MLNGELYAQRLQRLIYLDLSTDCFMKIFLHSTGHFFLTHFPALYTLILVNLMGAEWVVLKKKHTYLFELS